MSPHTRIYDLNNATKITHAHSGSARGFITHKT
jgi:hypothetical protein